MCILAWLGYLKFIIFMLTIYCESFDKLVDLVRQVSFFFALCPANAALRNSLHRHFRTVRCGPLILSIFVRHIFFSNTGKITYIRPPTPRWSSVCRYLIKHYLIKELQMAVGRSGKIFDYVQNQVKIEFLQRVQ